MHLTAIPSPAAAWGEFTIGPLDIHTYALCILAGIVLAVVITQRRLKARGVDPGIVIDVALWAVPLGIIGSRLYHVFTHNGDYFYSGANLWNIFAIWDGGDAIFGAMIGGFIGIVIACRRARLRLTAFVDALAPGMLVAQAVGRLGNWFNHELFGLPTTLPWGLEIPRPNAAIPAGTPAGTLFHPLFLYELIFDLLGAVVILVLSRRLTLQWGRQIGIYFVWYGLVRSWLEAIRLDPTSDRFLGIAANDWTSFGAVALGVVILAVQIRTHPGPEPSPMLPPRGPRASTEPDLPPVDEAAADAAEVPAERT